jgi:hypothetical protein
MKKLFVIMLAAMSFAACVNDDAYDLDYFTQNYGNNGKDTPADSTATDSTIVAEPDTFYVNIAYNGNTASLTGDVDKVTISRNDADVIITSTLTKYLQLTLNGTTTDGSLLVYSQAKYGLVLDGVTIANQRGPAINNQCSKALYLTLADGTVNTLTDGTDYTDTPINSEGKAIDQKATLFSEGQIYFQGTGSLTVNGNAKNGIASDDYIVFEQGTISVNVSSTGSNGVKVNDGLTINGGTLTIGVTADGARGIRSESYTTITGGTTTITTKGDCEIKTTDEGVDDASSAAGIKCDSLFSMSGGELAITSSGDGGKGINCSQNVEVSGGTLTITTTGDNEDGKPKGIKSDTGIIVSGGSVSVSVEKSWACDNGSDSEDPTDRVTVQGNPKTCSLAKRKILINF